MAYAEGLAQRVRELLEDRADDLEVVEKKMFGGLCFMVRGNMFGGILQDDMMVRVGAEGHTDALAQPHARPMDFTGKAMKGMVYVGPEGLEGDDDLESWLQRGLNFTLSLPAK
jgi:TfoX/Sxy family transcriptional regulator of competence genes